MANNECYNFDESITVHHYFAEWMSISVCVTANDEMLLHPTDKWLQRLEVPDDRLPHIQILQLGHGLLGQDRQRAQDVSKEWTIKDWGFLFVANYRQYFVDLRVFTFILNKLLESAKLTCCGFLINPLCIPVSSPFRRNSAHSIEKRQKVVSSCKVMRVVSFI